VVEIVPVLAVETVPAVVVEIVPVRVVEIVPVRVVEIVPLFEKVVNGRANINNVVPSTSFEFFMSFLLVAITSGLGSDTVTAKPLLADPRNFNCLSLFKERAIKKRNPLLP
jgi:hypothetical protein